MVAEPLTVRFLQNEYYDIEQDIDVVKLMAVTGKGTWCWTVPSKRKKDKKREFREYVIDQLHKGAIPCELEEDA